MWGLLRRTSFDPTQRIAALLSPKRRINLIYGNVRDSGSLRSALQELKPDEIYNLAAQSDVDISFKCPDETMETNFLALDASWNRRFASIRTCEFYQASTSEMFGNSPPPQSEQTPFAPVSPLRRTNIL